MDGLRGYSALYVLLLHCMMWGGWWPERLPDPKIAVDVFIIVSGFLMVYHWNSREYGSGVNAATVSRFLIKRFFRIAPLYYLAIAFAYLWAFPYTRGLGNLANQSEKLPIRYDGLLAAHSFYPANLWAHLVFLFGATTKYFWMIPDWSISLEMQFYVAFPFLLLAFRRIGYAWVAAAAIPLQILALHVWPFFYAIPSLLVVKLPIFFIGMLVAEANRIFWDDRTAGYAVFFLTMPLAALSYSIRAWILIAVAGVMFFLVSAPNVKPLAAPLSWARNVLDNTVAHFLAEMSYSVYLIHYFFIGAFGLVLVRFPILYSMRHIQLVALMISMTIMGSYLTALALHFAVEKPGIEFGKKLLRWSK